MSIVIAVSGMMGSGKSSLAEHLSAMLPDAVVVCEDEFHSTVDRSVDDMRSWLDRGADVAEFDLSRLAAFLEHTCGPRGTGPVAGAPQYVILETQFGRQHQTLQPWIDWQCWLDVPADICVMRKVKQIAIEMAEGGIIRDPAQGLHWIAEFCDSYVDLTHRLFAQQQTEVPKSSDIVLDGRSSLQELCTDLLESLPESLRSVQ